ERRNVLALRTRYGRERWNRRNLARDPDRRRVPHDPPTRRRRDLCAHRHPAAAAAHLPRRVPRRERAAALLARAQRARRVNPGYPQVAQSTVEMLTIQNAQRAEFSVATTLARPS